MQKFNRKRVCGGRNKVSEIFFVYYVYMSNISAYGTAHNKVAVCMSFSIDLR